MVLARGGLHQRRGMPLGAEKKERIFKCFSNYWKELKVRSLNIPSILLLIYATLIPVCRRVLQYITNGFVTPLFNNTECSNPNFKNSEGYINLLQYVPIFLIPFCGWLSDTKIGRGNAIYLSLWLGWVGTLLQSISYCLQYNSFGITALIGRYGFSGVAFVLLAVSSAFMYANILPYGIDQMINVPSVKIRAFIHWFVWDYSLGLFLSQMNLVHFAKTGVLIIAVAGCVLFSISLCLHFNLWHHFEHIPIPNPYKIVFKVLKYSIQNNHNRRQRSAFTYWGKEPSRIDLAKERYGGSFTHEEVENVKTLLRILVVMIALLPFFIIYFSVVDGIASVSHQYKDGQNSSDLYTTYVFLSIANSGILVLIPLFELVILPLFPKLEYFLINPLRGLGLANILIILSILSVFLIDLIGRVTNKSHDIPCFSVWRQGDPVIQVSFWILLIPSILAGISYALTLICTFEFLCSQAPFGMHGMIIGLVYFFLIFFGSSGLYIILYVPISSSSGMSCISWLSIIFGLVGLVGLVVYVLTARWYVKRIRDTDLDLRTEVEQQWEQRLIREDSHNNNNQTDYDTFNISSVEGQT